MSFSEVFDPGTYPYSIGSTYHGTVRTVPPAGTYSTVVRVLVRYRTVAPQRCIEDESEEEWGPPCTGTDLQKNVPYTVLRTGTVPRKDKFDRGGGCGEKSIVIIILPSHMSMNRTVILLLLFLL